MFIGLLWFREKAAALLWFGDQTIFCPVRRNVCGQNANPCVVKPSLERYPNWTDKIIADPRLNKSE